MSRRAKPAPNNRPFSWRCPLCGEFHPLPQLWEHMDREHNWRRESELAQRTHRRRAAV